ncbi:hypothetical protein GCM10020218_098700 [Dactylosporangium vinaceum]
MGGPAPAAGVPDVPVLSTACDRMPGVHQLTYPEAIVVGLLQGVTSLGSLIWLVVA